MGRALLCHGMLGRVKGRSSSNFARVGSATEVPAPSRRQAPLEEVTGEACAGQPGWPTPERAGKCKQSQILVPEASSEHEKIE